MSAVANYLARHCWYWMLYFMRRPWMKRLQRRWLQSVEGEPHKRFPDSFIKQNRFARRVGLRLLSFTITMFLASVFITGAYYLALYMQEGGYFNPPQRVARIER
jgi:hypothetical protein